MNTNMGNTASTGGQTIVLKATSAAGLKRVRQILENFSATVYEITGGVRKVEPAQTDVSVSRLTPTKRLFATFVLVFEITGRELATVFGQLHDCFSSSKGIDCSMVAKQS